MSLAELVAQYPQREPRDGVEAVRRLREAAGPPPQLRRVVVVGTNGKTSTASELARLLAACGRRSALSTSPHLRSWAERVRIDGEPVDEGVLEAEVLRLHELAQASGDAAELRFFDLLTLAAEQLAGRAGAEVGVFEAGIGGRTDATAALDPEIVLLTGVGLDHVELLGATPAAILSEKLAVAPPSATVVCGPLTAELAALAGEAELLPPGPAGAPPWEANARLARRGAELLGCSLRDDAGTGVVEGRLDLRTWQGTAVLLDAAHNEQAWEALLPRLPELLGAPRCCAVVSLSPDRDPAALARQLVSAGTVALVVTVAHTGRAARDPALVAHVLRAAGVPAEDAPGVPDALERARGTGMPVAIFGSVYLVADVVSLIA